MAANNQRILTINTGSSSLKAALYEMGEPASLKLSVMVSRINAHGCQMSSRMQITNASDLIHPYD